MFCKACGVTIDNDSKFCKECGAPQQGAVPKRNRSEVCKVTDQNDGPHFLTDKRRTRFVAEAGGQVIAASAWVEVHTDEFGKPKYRDDWASFEAARKAVVDELAAEGWEPVVDPLNGVVTAMQR